MLKGPIHRSRGFKTQGEFAAYNETYKKVAIDLNDMERKREIFIFASYYYYFLVGVNHLVSKHCIGYQLILVLVEQDQCDDKLSQLSSNVVTLLGIPS